MRPDLRAAIVALVLAGAMPAVVAARPVDLTPAEMRAFGQEALLRGFAEQALGIAEALLQRDPKDDAAWTLKAQALRVLNRLPESEAAARRAWDLAADPGPKYAAATAIAQALSLQGHRTQSQFWLREAVQVAPSPGARAQAIRDFQYVRSQNPLSLNLDVSAQPSSNVNGGTRVSSVDLGGLTFPLPGYLQALSGLTWGVGLDGSYKLAAGDRGETALTFGLRQQGVLLSPAARALAPGVANDDYALGHVEAGVQRKAVSAWGLWTLSAVAGRNRYAGKNLSATWAGTASLQQPLGQGSAALTWSAGLTRQDRLDDPASSSSELALGGQIRANGAAGDQWTAGLDLTRALSDAASVAHDGGSLTLGWQAARPVAGLDLSASLGLSGARYPGSGRVDAGWSAGFSATLAQASYLGFAPVLSVTLSENHSNFILYRTRTLGLGVSVASRF